MSNSKRYYVMDEAGRFYNEYKGMFYSYLHCEATKYTFTDAYAVSNRFKHSTVEYI